jgi:hypothetical protein
MEIDRIIDDCLTSEYNKKYYRKELTSNIKKKNGKTKLVIVAYDNWSFSLKI